MGTYNNDIWQDIWSYLGEVKREVLQAHISSEIKRALNDARTDEIARATAALFAAKLQDITIIQLLQEHWKLSKSEAIEALRIERTIESPIKVLKTYLKSEGLNSLEIYKYLKINSVKQQLESDSHLWKLSENPEKLKKVLESNSKYTSNE